MLLSPSDKLQMARDNIWIATVTREITTAEDAILEMSGRNVDTIVWVSWGILPFHRGKFQLILLSMGTTGLSLISIFMQTIQSHTCTVSLKMRPCQNFWRFFRLFKHKILLNWSCLILCTFLLLWESSYITFLENIMKNRWLQSGSENKNGFLQLWKCLSFSPLSLEISRTVE